MEPSTQLFDRLERAEVPVAAQKKGAGKIAEKHILRLNTVLLLRRNLDDRRSDAVLLVCNRLRKIHLITLGLPRQKQRFHAVTAAVAGHLWPQPDVIGDLGAAKMRLF